MAGKTVCVTGASGFIASWLVKLLLERGYTVRGTVRNPEKSKHLLQLPGASDNLTLVAANLLEQGGFDEAVQGCDGVFHTASPYFTKNVTDPQAQLIDPAVKGTLNVLASCARAQTKKVVLTSSVAAVAYTPKRTAGSFVDESWWTDVDYCEENKLWYNISKTLAEKAAWDFVKENGLNMATINPAMVIGPVLQDSKNTSSEIIVDILNGTTKTFPNVSIGWVGVKDVAMAHILAFESAHATGRHICSERVLHYADLIAILSKLYPTYPICAKDADETIARVPIFTLSNQKLKELGINFQPIEDVFQEAVTSFKECGWLA
ncbi:hypothetical protein CY35_16G016300 [Sphagnum magellanicum]|nr:hypothetical protein CY35_16G016300 [Sphagnum magellanicum]